MVSRSRSKRAWCDLLRAIKSVAIGLALSSPGACAAPKEFVTAPAAYTVEPGGEFEIQLPATAGTGFVWELASEPDPAIVKLVRHEAARADEAEGRVGGPVLSVFLFRGIAPGRTRLSLVYRRPFEAEVGPARRADYSVLVQPP